MLPARILLLLLFILQPALSQPVQSPGLSRSLQNGDFEAVTTDGRPPGWQFPQRPDPRGYVYEISTENAASGQRCAFVDATQVDTATSPFGTLNQVVDASDYRGKRVRFRAAVRVSDASENGRAQLWFRVNRQAAPGQTAQMGAFDNMQDRPIREENWDYYEIVADVDEDAATIVLGLLVVGNVRAWIDDASLDVIDAEDSAVTTRAAASGERGTDPPQPFFVWWLWLAVVGLLLLGLSHSGDGLVARFSFRFSLVYWVLYYLPVPVRQLASAVSTLVPSTAELLAKPFELYGDAQDKLVRWVAADVLGIEKTLVAPNGSGDTTFAYVNVLVCFVLALSVALVWSLIMRRRASHPVARDLLRSFLRYTLAVTMLSYGTAKLGATFNQFPVPDVDRLMKSYGDSSPMNLVWTFMGASRAYTMFAGLSEVAAALLLVWRRTTILGALVAAGVMLNVMMLNFCYDVPVKQYSAHLLVTALFLLLPDARRLWNVLLANRSAHAADLNPPWIPTRWRWPHRIVKVALVAMLIAVPLYVAWKQDRELSEKLAVPDWYGSYEVVDFRIGENGSDENESRRWESLTLRRVAWNPSGMMEPNDYVTIRLANQQAAGGPAKITDGDTTTISFTNASALTPESLQVDVVDDSTLRLTGQLAGQELVVTLRQRKAEDFLLMSRGFRWINEYPFNR